MEPWHTEVATVCNKIIVAELLTFHDLWYFAIRQDSRLMLIYQLSANKIGGGQCHVLHKFDLPFRTNPMSFHVMSMIFPRYRPPTSFRVKATPDFGWGSLPPALPDRAVCNAYNWL